VDGASLRTACIGFGTPTCPLICPSALSALRTKEVSDAAHKRKMATLQAAVASRAEHEAAETREAAQLETEEPRRSWALRAAQVAAIDAKEQRQWAEKLDAEATALEARSQREETED
jgi:hypothetical protein